MDWKEVFQNYKKCKFADIKKFLTEAGTEKAEAYKAIVKKQVNDKVSFLKIKKAFYEEFFPEFIPVKHKGMVSDVEEW